MKVDILVRGIVWIEPQRDCVIGYELQRYWGGRAGRCLRSKWREDGTPKDSRFLVRLIFLLFFFFSFSKDQLWLALFSKLVDFVNCCMTETSGRFPTQSRCLQLPDPTVVLRTWMRMKNARTDSWPITYVITWGFTGVADSRTGNQPTTRAPKSTLRAAVLSWEGFEHWTSIRFLPFFRAGKKMQNIPIRSLILTEILSIRTVRRFFHKLSDSGPVMVGMNVGFLSIGRPVIFEPGLPKRALNGQRGPHGLVQSPYLSPCHRSPHPTPHILSKCLHCRVAVWFCETQIAITFLQKSEFIEGPNLTQRGGGKKFVLLGFGLRLAFRLWHLRMLVGFIPYFSSIRSTQIISPKKEKKKKET